MSCPGGCICPCHVEVEKESTQFVQIDFGSLDQIMMMMIFGASNIVDKQWSVSKQAKTIAEFYAQFLYMRTTHETGHVIKQIAQCPFCVSMSLALALNRKTSNEHV